MLYLEIFENREALSEYFMSNSGKVGKRAAVFCTYQEIMERFEGKAREWYKIAYHGKRDGLLKHLSALRIDNWKDYFLHINMPESYTMTDMTDVASEICKYNNSPKVEPLLRCTFDPQMPDGEIEVIIVVPKLDLSWHFENMMR